ncbi:hypothetical protein KIN20_025775 [Parelaphostrongylus tenuis]|uniref:Uncharacterized protein n=1 Tax=Parelaphostrongylus tenuis TaxID=148309 RepID=A0AAD5MVR3_PARTN|nr:hypothetical protein KIN20_025775 [Parelaphostrongylus tenuis]
MWNLDRIPNEIIGQGRNKSSKIAAIAPHSRLIMIRLLLFAALVSTALACGPRSRATYPARPAQRPRPAPRPHPPTPKPAPAPAPQPAPSTPASTPSTPTPVFTSPPTTTTAAGEEEPHIEEDRRRRRRDVHPLYAEEQQDLQVQVELALSFHS